MKKIITTLFAVFVLALGLNAQKYMVGFYNVENLFDIYDDPNKADDEFTPEGKNHWIKSSYLIKQGNIARTIRAMAEANGSYHAILGLAEVENKTVLKDLVAQESIKDANFRYVHHEGPDGRGIDVALLYRPDVFDFEESESIPYKFRGSKVETGLSPKEKKAFRTRDILMVRGKLAGEEFAFYVAHLPSRQGGKSGSLRSVGAEIIYNHSMYMMEKYPGIKIVVMGDMNDDPTDESQVVWLHSKGSIAETGERDYFSPFIPMLKAGYGSLEYHGKWNIFDIIQVNSNLISNQRGTLRILKNQDGFYGNIFRPDFLIQQNGEFSGTPYRTFSRGKFIKGYSDHLPTYIILGR